MSSTSIFFGTNRRVDSEDPAAFGNPYNAERPYHFRIGQVPVEKRAESWDKPDKAYRCGQPVLFEERPAKGAAKALLGSRTLFKTLHGTMKDDPRDVIVFLHGFASSFESAMERAAELRDQYLSPATDPVTGALMPGRREPLIFAFSWPSDGKTMGFAGGSDQDDRRRWAYSSDREDARASGAAMARCAVRMFKYLADMKAQDQCHQRVHLVAHSMGNWALRHAVQELMLISEQAGVPLQRLFENTFLMAADINDDALEKGDWLAPILRLSRKVHVYHASNDTALSVSDVKPNHGARLGHFGPANMNRLNDRVFAIDCTDVSFTPALTHVRHQYYRLAPEVTRDVRNVLADKNPDEMKGRIALGDNRYRLKLNSKAREKLRGN
ncbi:MAG: alpha/beta hydrolase [Pseudomonadota bacterium]